MYRICKIGRLYILTPRRLRGIPRTPTIAQLAMRIIRRTIRHRPTLGMLSIIRHRVPIERYGNCVIRGPLGDSDAPVHHTVREGAVGGGAAQLS